MGSPQRNAGTTVLFFVEAGHCHHRSKLFQNLLQALCWDDQARAGCRLPPASSPVTTCEGLGHLGWIEKPQGKAGQEICEGEKGRLEIAFLPAYASELTSVEYLWGHWKMLKLPNSCTSNYNVLSGVAIDALKRIRRRRSTLVTVFWKHVELAL